jgi:hypothetical protein
MRPKVIFPIKERTGARAKDSANSALPLRATGVAGKNRILKNSPEVGQTGNVVF